MCNLKSVCVLIAAYSYVSIIGLLLLSANTQYTQGVEGCPVFEDPCGSELMADVLAALTHNLRRTKRLRSTRITVFTQTALWIKDAGSGHAQLF